MLTELLLGTGVGLALGLTGSGGVLAVPALMLGLGFSLQQAAPVSLIAIGIASLVGSLDGLRQGIVRYRAALLMALAGTACAPLGIWLSHQLPTHWIMVVFIALLLFIAGRMTHQALQPAVDTNLPLGSQGNCLLDEDTGRFQWNLRCFTTVFAIGGSAGLTSGLLGVGGGFLIVPGIRHFSLLGMHSVVATSLAVITLISAGTVAQSLWHGAVIPVSGWWFIGATIVGLVAGRALAPRLPAKMLQLSFSVLAVLVAAMLAQRFLLG